MDDLKKIAVVIDADNTQLSKIGNVLLEISKHGRIVVKRAYGNWRKDVLKNWEPEIERLAIKAVQQFDYVTGKNATDMALVIDTMDLLHTHIYDAFVIVSSDSDYTPLAIRLHESGAYVMGVGEKKTPAPFRNSCDEFLFLENIATSMESVQTEKNPTVITSKTVVDNVDVSVSITVHNPNSPATNRNNTSGYAENMDQIHTLLRNAYNIHKKDDGFANIAPAGSLIKEVMPDFDFRAYGFMKLPQFLEAFPEKYEVKRYPGKGTTTVVAYRCIG